MPSSTGHHHSSQPIKRHASSCSAKTHNQVFLEGSSSRQKKRGWNMSQISTTGCCPVMLTEWKSELIDRLIDLVRYYDHTEHTGEKKILFFFFFNDMLLESARSLTGRLSGSLPFSWIAHRNRRCFACNLANIARNDLSSWCRNRNNCNHRSSVWSQSALLKSMMWSWNRF